MRRGADTLARSVRQVAPTLSERRDACTRQPPERHVSHRASISRSTKRFASPIPRARLLRLALALAIPATAIGCGGGDRPPAADPASAPAASASSAPSAPAAPLGSARVTGVVRFEGEAPSLRPIAMGADPKCEAKHEGPVANQAIVLGEGGTLGNVLVRVRWTGGPVGAPAVPQVLDQNGCLYTPRVLGVQLGQSLKVLNSDELLHNVHSTSKVNPPFNRAMPAAITETEFTFQMPEDAFLVKCDVHPWMAAYVTVTDHPFFAVSGADGSFEIEGLPAGTYELEAWHERLGTRTASVTVEDGGAATADFTFEPADA
jgi:plastocyanin